MMPWLKKTTGGFLISVHLTPRAKRDAIEGLHGDALKVKIKAPPVDGKANSYLLAFLAEKLGIPKSSVTLERGDTSREKQLHVRGLPEAEIRQRLG
jgi:uncharacterized protein